MIYYVSPLPGGAFVSPLGLGYWSTHVFKLHRAPRLQQRTGAAGRAETALQPSAEMFQWKHGLNLAKLTGA